MGVVIDLDRGGAATVPADCPGAGRGDPARPVPPRRSVAGQPEAGATRRPSQHGDRGLRRAAGRRVDRNIARPRHIRRPRCPNVARGRSRASLAPPSRARRRALSASRAAGRLSAAAPAARDVEPEQRRAGRAPRSRPRARARVPAGAGARRRANCSPTAIPRAIPACARRWRRCSRHARARGRRGRRARHARQPDGAVADRARATPPGRHRRRRGSRLPAGVGGVSRRGRDRGAGARRREGIDVER